MKRKRTILQVAAELEQMIARRELSLMRGQRSFLSYQEGMPKNLWDAVSGGRYRPHKLPRLEGPCISSKVDTRFYGQYKHYLVCCFCFEEFLPYDFGIGCAVIHYPQTNRDLDVYFTGCSEICLAHLRSKANRIQNQLEAECKAITRARNLLKQAKEMVRGKLCPNPLPSPRAESEPQMTSHV